MKKTMIAMAVAGVIAAPAAMADVSVSGNVKVDLKHTDSNTATKDQWEYVNDSNVNFSASEDLGNGMTAFAKVGLDGDSSAVKDSIVGLKGGFGTVMIGRGEDFTKSKMDDTLDTMGVSGAALDLAYGADRTDGLVAYVSPTISGVTVGLGGYVNNTAASSEGFVATDVYVGYSNGPLTLQYAQEKVDDELSASVDDDASTMTGNRKTNSFTASYTMGDVKLGAYSGKQETDTAGVTEEKTTGIIGHYTMGSNVIALGFAKDDAGSSDDKKYSALSLKHNLSGRTYVTVGMRNANDTNDDLYGVRMNHSF